MNAKCEYWTGMLLLLRPWSPRVFKLVHFCNVFTKQRIHTCCENWTGKLTGCESLALAAVVDVGLQTGSLLQYKAGAV